MSLSQYGRPASDEEFAPFFWMRDSSDPRVRFLWDCVKVSTRPDPSDAGMAYFLATGDVAADPAKLRQLLEDKQRPQPVKARNEVRLEAENFRHFERYEIEDRNDRNASHRLQAVLTSSTGRVRTALNEPYTADRGRYDVEVRYFDENGRAGEFSFSVDGDVKGSWKSPGQGGGWTTHTIPDVEIAFGDEIRVEADGAPGRLDFVQLNRKEQRAGGRAPTGASKTHSRFTPTGELDDPKALPGQIIIAGSNPGYLKYNGGGIAFLCGPDNPEEFFYLGELNADGTRSGGGQEDIIRRMGEAGVNAFHCQVTRLKRCNIKGEGDDTHCPFVDHDPAKPLNEKVLDQWEGWIGRLEAAGIVVHLEFYNDATDVELMGWKLDENGELHPDERRFFAGIVNRFKHHRNIIWGIEESVNKLPRERTPHFKKISELIAQTDDHNHPIVHSFVTPDTAERDLHPDAVMSGDYRDDPHIDIVTWLHVAPRGEDVEAQHREYLKWARRDNDRFVPMKNETEYHRVNRTTARWQQWACALAGMHALEAQHSASRPGRDEWLADDGRLAAFMEPTDFYRMRPSDDLAAGSTKWVLAAQKGSNGPGESYIAYTYDASGPIGIRNLPAGTYDLLWFDTVSGNEVTQKGVSASGEANWEKPDGIGQEVAVYVKRRR
jgi:hypothetical protein